MRWRRRCGTGWRGGCAVGGRAAQRRGGRSAAARGRPYRSSAICQPPLVIHHIRSSAMSVVGHRWPPTVQPYAVSHRPSAVSRVWVISYLSRRPLTIGCHLASLHHPASLQARLAISLNEPQRASTSRNEPGRAAASQAPLQWHGPSQASDSGGRDRWRARGVENVPFGWNTDTSAVRSRGTLEWAQPCDGRSQWWYR